MTRKFTAENLKDIVIGLDFDGTCVSHEFPFIGKDIGAVPVLKRLIKEYNVKFILNTVRDNKYLDEAAKWCKDNDIPLYGVNVNPEQESFSNSPKVHADMFIDDLSLGIPLIYPDNDITKKPHVDWKEVEKMLFDKVDGVNEDLNFLVNMTRRKMGM